jgi:hypothetical protein
MLQSLKSRTELLLLLHYTSQQGTNRRELLYATAALIRWLDVAGMKYGPLLYMTAVVTSFLKFSSCIINSIHFIVQLMPSIM